MTELENHLLNALRELSAQFKEQHAASKSTLTTLETMYARTLKENGNLANQVEALQSQTNELSRQMNRFISLYNQNK